MNQLDALKQFTTVVADTGDFLQLAQYQPTDATTNPSLILKSVQKPEYAHLLQETLAAQRAAPLDAQMDYLLVRFGCEILSKIAGRVSTEVDARLSFDTRATVERGQRVVQLYQAAGIDRSRVLIKIAATWEGIQAARSLEAQGIHTNLTLLFAKCQAVACAQAGVKLISPFVGRIYDWHKKAAGEAWDEQANVGIRDPGVRSVREIFQYFKAQGISTQIMGASFRNVGQIVALAGCDLLTIAPELLAQLQTNQSPLSCALEASQVDVKNTLPITYTEAQWRYALNADACANEKLAEGIRVFAQDTIKLEGLMQ